jgi:hypothetical protein
MAVGGLLEAEWMPLKHSQREQSDNAKKKQESMYRLKES